MKTTDGKGTTKQIVSAGEQYAIRRVKKARQKKSGGRRPIMADGYFAGLQSDKLNMKADDMLTILEVTMTSSGKFSDEQLKAATAVYIAEFTMMQGAWRQRHEKAVEKALKQLGGNTSLVGYARKQLDTAYRTTWRR